MDVIDKHKVVIVDVVAFWIRSLWCPVLTAPTFFFISRDHKENQGHLASRESQEHR